MKHDFLTTPQEWTRTPRMTSDRVQYAASIQGERVRRYDRIADVVLAVAIGIGFALWLVEALV